MKALSVRQPWVHCIFHLMKDIENRDWETKVRGRIIVHASKAMTRDDYEDCLATCHHISIANPFPHGERLPSRDELTFGALIGTVEIVDCVTRSTSPWFFGPYGFVLRNPVPFARPVPYKGRLGFFDVPDDVLRVAA